MAGVSGNGLNLVELHDDSEPRSEWRSAGYDREVVERVWSFAAKVPGNDPELWRKDEFGAWIHKLDYRKRNSEFGWEICDTGLGLDGAATHGIAALRPMQWQNYVDHVAATTQSRMTADGLHNVRKLL